MKKNKDIDIRQDLVLAYIRSLKDEIAVRLLTAEKPAEALPSPVSPTTEGGQLTSSTLATPQQAHEPTEQPKPFNPNLEGAQPRKVWQNGKWQFSTESRTEREIPSDEALPTQQQACLSMDVLYKQALRREFQQRALDIAAEKTKAESIKASVKREELELKKRKELTRKPRRQEIEQDGQGLGDDGCRGMESFYV